ncbi:MAG TPA: FHA domain-containing protein [Clostridia bacterium]|nr:FHA domain-containing protein [Clostridia bacterium]
MPQDFVHIVRYILPSTALIVLVYCSVSLLRQKQSGPVYPARLVNNANGEVIPLSNWENSVGRSNSCDIVLNYPTVSRFHAVVALRKNGWLVADTLSRTGVFINREQVKNKAFLEHGDIITFGGANLAFKLDKLNSNDEKSQQNKTDSGDIFFDKKQKEGRID